MDDQIVEFCDVIKIDCFRGSEVDVLSHFYYTAVQYKADIVIRITADCPLLDPSIANQALYLVSSGLADYASNIVPATWPDGLDCEAFTMDALEEAFKYAKKESDREHVTPYIRNNQHLFKVYNIPSPNPELHIHRWTIDTPEDLAYLERIMSKVKANPTTWDVLHFFVFTS